MMDFVARMAEFKALGGITEPTAEQPSDFSMFRMWGRNKSSGREEAAKRTSRPPPHMKLQHMFHLLSAVGVKIAQQTLKI